MDGAAPAVAWCVTHGAVFWRWLYFVVNANGGE